MEDIKVMIVGGGEATMDLVGSGGAIPSGKTQEPIDEARVDFKVGEIDAEIGVIQTFHATNAKINKILAALREFGIVAS